MVKEIMKFSVTKNGKPLDTSLYTWDSKRKIFKTGQSNLYLDFSKMEGCTFRTTSDCTFLTGSDCTFLTGPRCNFNTGSRCSFETGTYCNFKTGSGCNFDTGFCCSFITGENSVARDTFNSLTVDLSDYKKVQFPEEDVIYFDGKIMTYEEYNTLNY